MLDWKNNSNSHIFVVFLGILFFYLNLNRRLALSVFTMNKEKVRK